MLEEANNSKLRDNNVVLCRGRRENCIEEEEDTRSNGTPRFVDDEEEGDDVDELLDEVDDEADRISAKSQQLIKSETLNLNNNLRNCDDVADGTLVHLIVNNNNKESDLGRRSGSSCGDDAPNNPANAQQTGVNESMPANSDETLLSEEDDCVIVSAPSTQQYQPKQQQQRRPAPAQQPRHSYNHHHSHHSISINHSRLVEERDDDVVPLLSSSSPYRMDLSQDGGGTLRFDDRCSDSGVSSLRSTSSGDERSGSRSSALSSSDDSHTITPTTNHVANSNLVQQSQANSARTTSTEPTVRVWRDPNLLLESEPHVRHIHSVQHQTLLMSHPQTPATSGSAGGGGGGGGNGGGGAPSGQQTLYSPIAPPHSALMSPHPHSLQHHLAPPPNIYSPHHLADIMWKHQRYGPLPVTAAAHILSQQSVAAAAAAMVGPQGHAEDLVGMEQRERYPGMMQERERHHDRLIRYEMFKDEFLR